MSVLITLVSKHFAMTHEQAMESEGRPEQTRLEMAIHSLVNAAIEKEDIKAFQFLVEIMVGKLPEADNADDITDDDLKLLRRIKALKAEMEKRGSLPQEEEKP